MVNERKMPYLKYQIFSAVTSMTPFLKVRFLEEYIISRNSLMYGRTVSKNIVTIVLELPPVNAFHMFLRGRGTKAIIEKFEVELPLEVCIQKYSESQICNTMKLLIIAGYILLPYLFSLNRTKEPL